MTLLIKDLDTATRSFLIEIRFEVKVLVDEGNWTEITTPTGWTRTHVGATRAFLLDPQHNLRAELIKTKDNKGWYLAHRNPFTVMSQGCSSATVLHHNTPVYTGHDAYLWLDRHYPNWRNPARYWEMP